MSVDVDREALEAALQEALRSVDQSLEAVNRNQSRVEAVMRLGVAQLGGIVAILALLVDHLPGISPLAFGTLAVGVVGSVASLLRATFGLSVPYAAGREGGALPGTLRARISEPGFTKSELHWNLLSLMEDQLRAIQRGTYHLSSALVGSTWLLTIATLCYLLSFAFIAGGLLNG